MVIEGRLSHEQERDVVLTYLCGVKLDYILEHHGVPHKDQRQLANRTSREWNDSLVELYRQTHQTHRLRNSAHLYLAFHDRDVPQRHLIDLQRDDRVYQAVIDDIYTPLINRTIESTALESFNEPSNGLERLTRAIFGSRTAESVAEPILADSLHEEYQKGGRFSLDRAYEHTKKVLLSKIKYGALGIEPGSKKAEIIYEALATLPEEEHRALLLRFGLDNGRGRNLEEIARIEGVTRERRKIREESALRKLRHHSRYDKLRILTTPITDTEFRIYIDSLQSE